ncbi:MAG: VOC family protein [Gammaproteobacteria bacterium]|nr:VOC family protein [Gammaproteobacteria bacterium]MCP5200278.1 VOC family protein [Gammaproteobacteria bacterium]
MAHTAPPNPPATRGVHHVGLSVPDLAAARAFFVDALDYTVVGEKPDYPAVFVSDGAVMVTLWQCAADAAPFDRRRQVGLHHLALRVADLEVLAERLAGRPDTIVEFAPEPLGDSGTRHMMCAIPGGIRVEFIAPAGGA